MSVSTKVKIMQGRKTLFVGELHEANPKEFPRDDTEKRLNDLFNLERYINEQGAYRCHLEIVEPKATQ